MRISHSLSLWCNLKFWHSENKKNRKAGRKFKRQLTRGICPSKKEVRSRYASHSQVNLSILHFFPQKNEQLNGRNLKRKEGKKSSASIPPPSSEIVDATITLGTIFVCFLPKSVRPSWHESCLNGQQRKFGPCYFFFLGFGPFSEVPDGWMHMRPSSRVTNRLYYTDGWMSVWLAIRLGQTHHTPYFWPSMSHICFVSSLLSSVFLDLTGLTTFVVSVLHTEFSGFWSRVGYAFKTRANKKWNRLILYLDTEIQFCQYIYIYSRAVPDRDF